MFYNMESFYFYNVEILLNGNVSFPNVTPVLILRRYMLLVLVPAEMEVRVNFLEILQANNEHAYKHSGAQLGGLFGGHMGMPCQVP